MRYLPRLLFVLAFLFTSYALIAQEEEIIEEEEVVETAYIEKEIISLSRLVQMMQADESETIISDYEIVSASGDDKFLVDKVFFSLYELLPGNAPAKKIYFYNCKFSLEAKSPLVFKNWEFVRLNVVGCEFDNPVAFEGLRDVSQRYPLLVENCTFRNVVEFSEDLFEAGSLVFRNNTFASALHVDMRLNNLEIENCIFDAVGNTVLSQDNEMTNYQFKLGEQPMVNFELSKTKFNNNGLQNVFSIDLSFTQIENVLIDSVLMQSMDLSSADFEKSLLVDSLFVENFIGILNFDFPEKNTNVSWWNLAGEKLAIFDLQASGLIVPYQAKTDLQLSGNLKYNDLMSAYNKFNSLYHHRGDIASANASYVEIKDIETRRQAYVQKVNPSRNNLINYKLNVFLKFFSDYATNPGKSLIYSIYMVLLFALLYMFTFSRWDGMNNRYYLNQLNRFAEYVVDDKPIEDIFKKKEDELVKDVKSLTAKYIELGKDMPRILKLFGGPLHFLSKFRYDVLPGLIGLFNFQRKKWKKIKGFKKIWAGFLIILIFLLFSVYVVFVKFFNSLIMSLNSFVVIGFGSLPEEDTSIAMYLSIIEGIIGWFLLTIFTITLLSQVLQNA